MSRIIMCIRIALKAIFNILHQYRCPGQPAVELTAWANVNSESGDVELPSNHQCVVSSIPYDSPHVPILFVYRNIVPSTRPWKDIVRERKKA